MYIERIVFLYRGTRHKVLVSNQFFVEIVEKPLIQGFLFCVKGGIENTNQNLITNQSFAN